MDIGLLIISVLLLVLAVVVASYILSQTSLDPPIKNMILRCVIIIGVVILLRIAGLF
jgi:hypothetical protein